MHNTEEEWRQIAKLLQSCALSLERLTNVIEHLVNNNVEIKPEMMLICKQFRKIVTMLEDQCDQFEYLTQTKSFSSWMNLFYGCIKHALHLLSRTLELIEQAVLQPLLTNCLQVHLHRLENVTNYTEFIKCYSQHAFELLQLIQFTCKQTRSNENDKRRKLRLLMEQQLLQRCVILLLTSYKICIQYNECAFAANNRKMLIQIMRKSMDYIQQILLKQYLANVKNENLLAFNPLVENNTTCIEMQSNALLPIHNLAYFPNLNRTYLDNLKFDINHLSSFDKFIFNQMFYNHHIYPENLFTSKLFQNSIAQKNLPIFWSYSPNSFYSTSNNKSINIDFPTSCINFLTQSNLDSGPNKAQIQQFVPSAFKNLNVASLAKGETILPIFCCVDLENNLFLDQDQKYYLLNQQRTLQQQQYFYYKNNLFTSVFNRINLDISSSDQCLTIYNLLCTFENLISLNRLNFHSQTLRDRISHYLKLGAELSQEFTDSAYTKNVDREKIVLLNERILLELTQLFQLDEESMEKNSTFYKGQSEMLITQILTTCSELKQQLQQAALGQAHFFFRYTNLIELMLKLKSSSLFVDCQYLLVLDQYIEHYEHLLDTIKQLHQIAPTDSQQIRSKHAYFCISIFGPMLMNALKILINHYQTVEFDNQIAILNFRVFSDLWIQLYGDIYLLYENINEQIAPYLNKTVKTCSNDAQYLQPYPQATVHSSPNSNVPNSTFSKCNPHSGTNSKFNPLNAPSSVTFCEKLYLNYQNNKSNSQYFQQNLKTQHSIAPQQNYQHHIPPNKELQNTADQCAYPNYCSNCVQCKNESNCCEYKNNVPVNNCTTCQQQLGAENTDSKLNPNQKFDENEIVEKGKLMTSLVQSMIEFTKGTGELRTTQNFFTQAEFFADEANKFYKIIRQFTYLIPSSQLKKELLEYLDEIPTYVQELMFTVKNNTVGKAATFTKVDMLLVQSNQLLDCVHNTVHYTIQCAKRYNIDLDSIPGQISPMLSEDAASMRNRSETRRKHAAQQGSDSRRTRVSFLLF